MKIKNKNLNSVAAYLAVTVLLTACGGGGGAGGSSDGDINQPVDGKPSAVDDVVSVREGETVQIFVLQNDDFGSDGHATTTISLSQAPGQGHASVDDNGTPNDASDDFFIYTASKAGSASDSFVYGISDSDGDTDTATVTVSIEQKTDFIDFAITSAGKPKVIKFTWSVDIEPAEYRLEYNPDGVSGYHAFDINGDGSIDDKDLIEGSASEVEVELSIHLLGRTNNATFQLVALSAGGEELDTSDYAYVSTSSQILDQITGYFKASNTSATAYFGYSVAISSDGTTMIVGAEQEDTDVGNSGAAYIFVRNADRTWSEQAVLKASTLGSDHFGGSVSISGDGNTVAVGAEWESSAATGIDGDELDNSANLSGAVYVFTRSVGGGWSQQAFIKASNTDMNDHFGADVSLSADGDKLAVGASWEGSAASGVGADESNNDAGTAGAAYVFSRESGVWKQDAYIKASNPEAQDYFGSKVALSGDGITLAVAAPMESSNAVGVDGVENSNDAPDSGAVYVYEFNGTQWVQTAYIKASNTDSEDEFGHDVALSYSGDTLAVSASGEDSDSTGINSDSTDNSGSERGAAYIFSRGEGAGWFQHSYIKPSFIPSGFASSLALSSAGDVLSVGAERYASWAGAVFTFKLIEDTTWTEVGLVDAPAFDVNDSMGFSVALSGDGKTLVAGAKGEDSSASGIGGDHANNDADSSGAVWMY